jgi:PAS domain S-box-containing protein
METGEKSRIAEQIVNEAHDAIIMADREGIIHLWNKGAENIFGYDQAEVIGRSLNIIIPENLRERHNRGYQQVMESGRSRYASELLAVPAINKNGSRISVEFSLVLIRDQQDRVFGAAAIIRDVSLRWERDQAIKRRLAEMDEKLPCPSKNRQWQFTERNSILKGFQ